MCDHKEVGVKNIFFASALLFLVLTVFGGITRGLENPVTLTYQLIFWVMFATASIIEAIEKKEGK